MSELVNYLIDISIKRLTHPTSTHILLYPYTVYYQPVGARGRYDVPCHITEAERDAIASLWFMPLVCMTRSYEETRKVKTVFRYSRPKPISR